MPKVYERATYVSQQNMNCFRLLPFVFLVANAFNSLSISRNLNFTNVLREKLHAKNVLYTPNANPQSSYYLFIHIYRVRCL